MYLGDWRISPEERVKYDSYFQQCNPIQGYLTGRFLKRFLLKLNKQVRLLR
jgi:hypothetical protein